MPSQAHWHPQNLQLQANHPSLLIFSLSLSHISSKAKAKAKATPRRKEGRQPGSIRKRGRLQQAIQKAINNNHIQMCVCVSLCKMEGIQSTFIEPFKTVSTVVVKAGWQKPPPSSSLQLLLAACAAS
ncbi:MAG: hypothetical protein ACRDCT_30805 [Shewanella sp.]